MADISVLNIPEAIPECNAFLTGNRPALRHFIKKGPYFITPLENLLFLTGLALTWSSDYTTNIKDKIPEKSQTMNEQAKIELFDNPRPQRDYCITIRCPEFTSVCPRTGQPDFGQIIIEYCPDKSCIELKSLKFYMQSYRNKGIFYEALTNDILDDLVGACRPRWMKVTSRFRPRGGITTEIVAEYKAASPEAKRNKS
jgi:7-cyano-7-deazaguanine reductase